MYLSFDSYILQPKIIDLNTLYEEYGSNKHNLESTLTLDLGCGETPKNPFNATQIYGLDIREDLKKNIVTADLTLENIPFSDNSFDFITAYDFLEHIPRVIYTPKRRLPFIELMNEVYRTLKHGGVFFSRTPCYPISSTFTDPTHINFITADTFTMYFDNKNQWAKIYGFKGNFKVELQGVHNTHLITILKKT